jgi:hypothetical protein
MKIVPAVDAEPDVADVLKIVSLTSTGLPENVRGILSTGWVAVGARTIYRESSLRMSSSNSLAGSDRFQRKAASAEMLFGSALDQRTRKLRFYAP